MHYIALVPKESTLLRLWLKRALRLVLAEKYYFEALVSKEIISLYLCQMRTLSSVRGKLKHFYFYSEKRVHFSAIFPKAETFAVIPSALSTLVLR